MMSRIIFVRPGMTASGQAGRKLGQSDESLLEEERLRLSSRAEEGRYPAIGRLYTCPATRCRETAALAYPRMPAIMINKLAAFDCGDFEGMTLEELNYSEIFLDWVTAPDIRDCPGGGNLSWYAAQCIKTFRMIVKEIESYKTPSAAIVCHGLAISLIMQRICLPRTQYQDLPLPWGAALVLDFHPEQFAASVTEIL
jgi:broad specificity phosphatase PhoE